MALFLDTFVNKIDSKGRVSVPASFRAALKGQSFAGVVASPSAKFPAIQCAGIDWFQRLSNELSNGELFSDENDDLTAALFADAKQLAFDGEGRIMLPDILTQHAGLSDLAAFVGRGVNFEIWSPAAFESYKASARKRAFEKGRTLRPRQDGGK
ncbi:MAG TPA: division/cell wall cluster transcriptional repressor MraZ [Dongiaceae bacterium]|jgi:MraZ protein